ncbi:MAG: SDR family oxidoreductase [Chitinophagales bacterium]|jgi:NAD(P)-dependent dehydrogenase (short-subunit alcohol dehydrogenase family)|nr:SDR family oxidoreductase [Bacteroidota bacterium]MBP9221820.1 SDR family oxidoreductase [Chitinophagales bacterium]
MHNITIENKVVLITGAFGLIGKTISINFLHQGAKVILADIDQTKAENISEELKTLNPLNYLIIPLDITNENSCEKALEESVKKFGKIDVLINNAALDAKFDKQNISEINHSRFENYPLELFKKSVDVNITGTVLVTQVMIRQMLKQGYGNIINVASTYSLVSPNQKLYDFGDGAIQYKPVDYIVTKSFIPNFTKYLATFYAADKIRCNAIAPHGIFNDHDEKFLQNFAALSPIGRMADKKEMTGPFTFLASDASSYMTGTTLVVDGGWTAW